MRVLVALLCVFAVSMTTSCFRNKVVTAGTSLPDREPDFEKWQSHFLGGLIGTGPRVLSKICPHGVEAVKTYFSFLNMLVGLVTAEIYTPNVIQVWCRDGSSAEVPLAPDALSRLSEESPDLYQRFLADLEYLSGHPIPAL